MKQQLRTEQPIHNRFIRPLQRGVFAILSLFITFGLQAHGIHAVVDPDSSTVVIVIRYSDGSPFAYEQYEIFGPDDSIPFMNGRSDANGHILFSPDRNGDWKVRYFSQDGHGGELIVPFNGSNGTETVTNTDPNRMLRLSAGLGYLLGLFGLGLYLLERKKNRVAGQ